MWSEKVRFLSKITPRFLTRLDEVKVEDEEGDFKVLDWSMSLLSWSGRPIRRNSVLEGFKERRLVDIQLEMREIVSRHPWSVGMVFIRFT